MIIYSCIIVFLVSIRFRWTKAQACQLQTPCVLNDTQGNIITPGYPNSHPDNVKLAWLVTVPHGQSVRLVFEDFDLEKHKDCIYDHVTVYDGNTTGSPIIGKYCGTTKPPEQISTREQLLVVFISDHTTENSGFNISYEAIKRVDSCSSNYSIIENLNIILDKSPGTLQTEFNYNVTNVKCVWRIRAPRGYGIRLTFRYMNILPNVTCALRSVLLYSGYSMKEKYLMQRFCGENFAYSFPIIKYNPERNVIIELKAEQISSWDKQSFVASYEFIEKDLSKCSSLNSINENNNIKLNGYQGNFTVDNLWTDMTCRWKVYAPDKYQIKLKFKDFIMENDCHKVYVQVFDGESINRGKFCGPEIPWEIISTTGYVMVKLFVSGKSKALNITGLYEAVTIAKNECSTINTESINTNLQLGGLSGLFMTPNYPSNYPSNFKCVWIINVPEKYRIKLHFKDFQFEGHACRYDYVEVRDGGTSFNATKTGKICQQPNDVYSSSNKLWISFSSDHNNEEDGFLAYYTAVIPEPSKCAMVNTANENDNIQVRSSSGFLTSPNYPQSSPTIKCTWYIVVPRDSRIVIHVSDVNPTPWCDVAYLAVHDGNCTCNTILGNFCEKDVKTSTAVSSSNALTVVFRKPISGVFKGFNLSYHVPQLGSGVCSIANSKKTNSNLYLNKTSGIVTSPDYPYSSFPGTECTWYAVAPRGYHVLLTITTMNMSCGNNYLEVRDGESISSPLKGRFCYFKGAKRFYSSVQKLVLRYVSPKLSEKDPKYSGKFVGNYRMIKDGNCSEDFDESWNTNLHVSSMYGVVSSPGYPRPYPPNIKCTWKIILPYNSRVRLTFRHLSFGGSCSSDFLEVKDGLSSSGKLLGKFCKDQVAKEIRSSGRYILVHFESGTNLTSHQGFDAVFSAILTDNTSSHSTFEAVLIMGFITFAGFVVVSVCLMCIYWLCKKRWARARHRRRHPPEPHDLTVLSSLPHPALDDIPDCLIAEDRPPSYDDAVHNEEPQQDSTQEPGQLPHGQEDNPEPTPSAQEVGGGLDNPGFASDPPSYESLYGTEQT